jgi:hypothetical protein
MALLTRTDLTRNIDRFCLVHVTPTLFGERRQVEARPATMRLHSLSPAREGAVGLILAAIRCLPPTGLSENP